MGSFFLTTHTSPVLISERLALRPALKDSVSFSVTLILASPDFINLLVFLAISTFCPSLRSTDLTETMSRVAVRSESCTGCFRFCYWWKSSWALEISMRLILAISSGVKMLLCFCLDCLFFLCFKTPEFIILIIIINNRIYYLCTLYFSLPAAMVLSFHRFL